MRPSKEESLPQNCCAFRAVFDALEKNNIMKGFLVNKSGIDPLVDILLGSKNASYASAIDCLVKEDLGKALNPIGQLQDPWRVLTLTLAVVNNHSTRAEKNPLYPVFGCDCGLPNRTVLQGSMDYRREGLQTFRPRNVNCEACGGEGRTTNLYLPNDFFIRLC